MAHVTIDATTERAAFDGRRVGAIALPADAADDASRQAWNLAVDARPALHPLLKETDR